jgi:hypothetical protein
MNIKTFFILSKKVKSILCGTIIPDRVSHEKGLTVWYHVTAHWF